MEKLRIFLAALFSSCRSEAGHLPAACLHLSHQITRRKGIFRSAQNSDLVKLRSLPAGTGPGLGLLGSIKVASAAAAKDDVHIKL